MEKQPSVPAQPQPQPAQQTPQTQPPQTQPAQSQPQSPQPQQSPPKKKPTNKLLIIIIILIVIAAIISGVGLGGKFLYEKMKKDFLANEAEWDKKSDEMFNRAMEKIEEQENGSTPSTDSGGSSSSTSLSESFPGDISIYSGSTTIKSAEKDNEILAGFTTSDSAETVYNFYKKDLAAKGWKITSSAFYQGQGVIYASKVDRMLIMSIYPENGKTTIAMDINLPSK